LQLKGAPDEVELAFRGVDVNDSGTISEDEFRTAIKGERMEELSNRIILADDLQSSQMSTAERTERNAELRKRIANMKKEMGGKMQNMMSKMMGVVWIGSNGTSYR
tara:strand:+ start:288 stop:605 length:318 start_codon:yes stop_codon:yes gene_type:complete